MAIDRTAIARALLGPLGVNVQPLNNHIFMANQAGYRDNAGDIGRLRPRQRATTARRGGLEAGGQRAEEGRPSARDQVRHPGGVATRGRSRN